MDKKILYERLEKTLKLCLEENLTLHSDEEWSDIGMHASMNMYCPSTHVYHIFGRRIDPENNGILLPVTRHGGFFNLSSKKFDRTVSFEFILENKLTKKGTFEDLMGLNARYNTADFVCVGIGSSEGYKYYSNLYHKTLNSKKGNHKKDPYLKFAGFENFALAPDYEIEIKRLIYSNYYKIKKNFLANHWDIRRECFNLWKEKNFHVQSLAALKAGTTNPFIVANRDLEYREGDYYKYLMSNPPK